MTSPERHHRLQDLVEAALEMPADDRNVYLGTECAGDLDLLKSARELLELYSDADPVQEAEHIGPYRIIKELGVGGMGVVYLAEREDDYHRTVAVKVIRRGMDTDFFLGRFFKEREILGALNHPGVVRIVDAGSTLDGRPFLVMDYVDGLRIDKYFDGKSVTLNDRLGIFLKVCSAVQHAHRNLIVHRDLKPGNILVTPEGEPKLLDFGIAKVVDENDERTQLTIPIMTRQYAAPEQVKGKRITTSCDIYALGLILYEMLTGARPYDLKDKPVDEVERIVCDIDPPPPSVSVTESSTRHTLRGDLDRIVMMALRKEPERRYGSVEAMARDIHRYLDGRPVSAQPDTWTYRTGKFFQRNRTPAVVASVIGVMLLGGGATVAWQGRVMRQERARGQQQRDLAESRLKDMSNLLFDIHSAIREVPGLEAVRMRIVDETIRDADRLVEVASGDARLLSEAAGAYERVGLLEATVATEVAHASQTKAIETRRKASAAEPGNPQWQRELAASYVKFATLEQQAAHTDTALDYANRAIPLCEQANCVDVEIKAYAAVEQALKAKGDLVGAAKAARRGAELSHAPKP